MDVLVDVAPVNVPNVVVVVVDVALVNVPNDVVVVVGVVVIADDGDNPARIK